MLYQSFYEELKIELIIFISKMKMKMELHDYLIMEILDFLNGEDLFILYETCKTFHELINHPRFLYRKVSLHPYNVVRDIKTIEWAQTHSNFRLTGRHMQFALRRNSNDVIIRLLIECCGFNRYCYREAIQNGNNKTIHLLQRYHCPMNADAFAAAAEMGNLKLLKLFYKKNCTYDYNLVTSAAYSGHLPSLKFLIKKGYAWDSSAFNSACESGSIDVLTYLFNEAVNDLSKPWWSSSTCVSAAENGHLHLLQFLRENKCPWGIDTIYAALQNGHFNIIDWAIKNGCEIDEDVYEYLPRMGLNYTKQQVKII